MYKFKKGDIVIHKEHGVGIVESSGLISHWVMDRPIKNIEKKIYSVLFSNCSSIKRVCSESLNLFLEV
jgi:RNA polymerase-interacting CarD/CdnL/TRCF family regulator